MSTEEKTLSRRGFLTAALAAIPATAILAASADPAEAGGLAHKHVVHHGHGHHKYKRGHGKKVFGHGRHHGRHHKYSGHGFKSRRRSSVRKRLKIKKIFKF